jgi:hypothetical protein
MEKTLTHDIVDRPTANIIAEAEGLAISLAESFLSNFCRVNVFAENEENWNRLAHHLKDNSFIRIFSLKDLSKESDYLIYLSILFSKQDSNWKDLYQTELARIDAVKDSIKERKTRGLFIAPFNNENVVRKMQQSSNILSKFDILFVGNLIGPRMFLSDRDPAARVIQSKILNYPIEKLKNEMEIYPIYIGDLSKLIIKQILSFGSLAKESYILGSKISFKEFVGLVEAFKEENFYEEGGAEEVLTNRTDNVIYAKSDLKKAVKQTLTWFKNNKYEFLFEDIKNASATRRKARPKTQKAKITKNKVVIPKNVVLKNQVSKKPEITHFKQEKNLIEPTEKVTGKYLTRLAIVFLFFLITPFVFTTVSLFSLLFGVKNINTRFNDLSDNAFVISEKSSTLSHQILAVYTKIPLLGRTFAYVDQHNLIFIKTSDIALDVCVLSDDLNDLMGNIVGDRPYDVSYYSKKIPVELDSLYKKTSFLESEILNFSGFGEKYYKVILSKYDFARRRQEILAARDIFVNLGDILGQDKEKTYLILMQNNMEIRPTGGFIGSFSLIKFEGGRLVDINVMDVYSADGQLRGYVRPPDPLRSHLNVDSWYLRDSNWDPDFPVSAQRAEWFLDKEVEKTVDGVIGLDLQVAKDLVSNIGEVKLEDFDKTITEDNFYEITQEEAEKDFFAGSRKKANFLAALTRKVLFETRSLKDKNQIGLADAIYKDLNERHIQVFIHNNDVQSAVSKLGWDGAVLIPACDKTNCYADWAGIVEANVGVNKANYYISRKTELSLSVDKGRITRSLTVTFINSADASLGHGGKYRNYLRLLIPSESEIDEIKLSGGSSEGEIEQDVSYLKGRKEVGVFLEIDSQETKKIRFVWTNNNTFDFTRHGEYRFYWRKQAGLSEYPMNLKMFVPENLDFESIPHSSLTKESEVIYNTQLSSDFFSKIYW